MDSCYHHKVCNCLGGCKNNRPDNHECCVQNTPTGVKPTYGVWVKSGTCNRDTGHCKSPKKVEKFHSWEGYRDSKGDSCGKWRTLYLVFIFLSVLLGLCAIMYCCSKNQ